MVAEVKRKQEKKEKKRKKREKRRLEALAAAAEEMENSVQEAEVRAEAPSALWAVPLWWPHCAVTTARLPQQCLLLLPCCLWGRGVPQCGGLLGRTEAVFVSVLHGPGPHCTFSLRRTT